MIDPSNITNFNQTDSELEENIIFWILVAGKTAAQIVARLDRMLSHNRSKTPFEVMKSHGRFLPNVLKNHGIGCYNTKAKSIQDLIAANLNLRTCSVKELECIYGIGPKTARCFLIHSRPDARYAGLDTHALKFLKDMGMDVPKSTPTGRRYRELEKIFLDYVDRAKMSISEFDLLVWNAYSGNDKSPKYKLVRTTALKGDVDVLGSNKRKVRSDASLATTLKEKHG